MERFLYRLSKSEHAVHFILKGALMLRAWKSPEIRPTKDIDMLGITSNDVDDICKQVSDIISLEQEDGLVFSAESIRGEVIKEDADYEGVRVRFICTLENARIPMQIDIGFGDIVYPEALQVELPTVLDLPAPVLPCYSRESAIAEKFEAMIKLGELNSRMKDFYDIWLLSRQFVFNGDELLEAVKLTFKNRGTALPDEITAFNPLFVENTHIQWNAFHGRLKQDNLSKDFSSIVSDIQKLLLPVIDVVRSDKKINMIWNPGKGWQ
ncbi:MAG: nucleotidyl transferase AbiEii/AbiGii toxin family protein [Gammaproteobacteria bacterium]|nr:nucleotidyl transferase AbiEii/AbiGii toxin family protein [Gammaproteobacteria bacterium]